MSTAVNLTQNESVDLSILRDQGKYPEAYDYLRDIVDRERRQTTDMARSYDLLNLRNWLDRASSINSNDGSFSSEFVRGATAGVRARLGNPLSDSDFQDVSDSLADKVIGDAINGGGIPNLPDIIKDDVASAVRDTAEGGLGLPPWGWDLGRLGPTAFWIGRRLRIGGGRVSTRLRLQLGHLFGLPGRRSELAPVGRTS